MSSSRISSLELGRLFAIFAVVIIHAAPLRGDSYSESFNLLSDIVNQLSRFAVPFFFILAGYFIQPSIIKKPLETCHQYCRPLLLAWLAWSLIYLVIPFRLDVIISDGYVSERIGYFSYLMRSPINTLFEGGFVHLWYLPALICAIALLTILLHLKQQKYLLPIGITLFIWGLSAGSYEPIFNGEAPIFTRNGPFFSFIMVVVGFEFRRRETRITTRAANLLTLLGISLILGEGWYLSFYDKWMAEHDFLIGTPLFAVGIFHVLLNHPTWGNTPWVLSLSQRVFGVYLCHFVILFVLWNLIAWFSVNAYVKDLVLVPMTLVLSFLFVVFLEKSHLTSWLVGKKESKQQKLTNKFIH